MSKFIYHSLILIGLFFIPTNMFSMDGEISISEKKKEAEEETFYDLIAEFEYFQQYNWSENRLTATRLVQKIGSLKKTAAVKKFQKEDVLPVLLGHLDFRRTRSPARRRFKPPFPKPMYPVTNTLIEIGQPVVQPLLKAVAKHSHSSTYLFQARLVLEGITQDEKAVEKLIKEYAKSHPKQSTRILRLSKKLELKAELKKEEQFNSAINILEWGYRWSGRSNPDANKQNIKTLKWLEELISTKKDQPTP